MQAPVDDWTQFVHTTVAQTSAIAAELRDLGGDRQKYFCMPHSHQTADGRLGSMAV
jgi:hypothetical protein